MSLSFLKNNNKWPKLRKLTGESKYGFSEDDNLKESAIQELLMACESKDSAKIHEALTALIHLILEKEHGPKGDDDVS